MTKQYLAKAYSLDGTLIKTFSPSLIMNEPGFTSKVSGGQGECSLELALPFDDFGEGGAVKAMNVVKIYESDDRYNLSPVLIYTGFVSQYTPFFSDSAEGVRLTLLGLASLLTTAFYAGSHTAADVGDIAKAIVDAHNTGYPYPWVSYSGGYIVNDGSNVNLTIDDTKGLEALKKTFDLGGTNKYWYIDEAGQVRYQVKPSSATHRFTIGKDISRGEIVKNTEQMVNSYKLTYGAPPVTKNYTDATSLAEYGKHQVIESDTAIGDVVTADAKAAKKFEDYAQPRVQAKLFINATYNIETVRPGDTCSIFNFKEGSTLFPQNMQITSVRYSPDGLEIELENERGTFAEALREAVA